MLYISYEWIYCDPVAFPGEGWSLRAEKLFEKGIGQPWVGGNQPSSNSSDHRSFGYPRSVWGWGYDRFSYYNYQGKTYIPYRYFYPYTYDGGYLWSL
jgi:hypothetical protein